MTRYLLVLLPLFLFGNAYGQDGFRPANFDFEEDKRRMDKLIEFPDIEGDLTVMLLCFSRVQPNGKMESTGCYAPKNYDEPFAMAVNWLPGSAWCRGSIHPVAHPVCSASTSADRRPTS